MEKTIFMSLFMLPILLGGIFLFGLGVYALILLIKLMKRGIIALDIYIDKNRQEMGEIKMGGWENDTNKMWLQM